MGDPPWAWAHIGRLHAASLHIVDSDRTGNTVIGNNDQVR